MWVQELERICDVFPASDAYKADETPPNVAPSAVSNFVVAKPKSTQEVAEVLKFASKNKIPVFVRGGGTGLSGGAVPTSEGIVLSTERLKTLEIDVRNRVATCGAGVTLQELESAAERSGLSFPPHPGAETATVGGMIATNAGGVRALKYGTMRSYVLGAEVVLPNGEVLQLGSKTLKNSTGYSLLHLIIGSEGTLGVITRAHIKLHPPMRGNVSLAIPFHTLEDAIDCVAEIMLGNVIPMAVEFMERRAVEVGEAVSGKRWPAKSGEAHLLVIVESFEEAERIAEVAENMNAIDVLIATSRREQRDLLDVRSLIYEGLKDKVIEVLDVCVPPAHIAEYVKRSNKLAAEYGIDVITYGHAGDGNVHQHPLLFDGWQEVYFKFREELFRMALELGGVISGEHGIGAVKKAELKKLMPKEVELMRAIKSVFDPANVLNPGKVV